MRAELRPSSLGEILDRTAQMYRSHFMLYFGIAAMAASTVLIPKLIGYLLLSFYTHGNATQFAGISVLISSFMSLISLLPMALSMAAIAHAVATNYLGRVTTIREAYSSIRRRWYRYILILLATYCYSFAPFFVAVGVVAAVSVAVRTSFSRNLVVAMLVVVILLALFAAFWWMLRWALAIPASLLEDLKVHRSLKRSALLTKGARGRIFVMLLLVLAVVTMISYAVQIPMLFLFFLHKGQLTFATQVLSSLGVFVSSSFVIPIWSIALTLFYYDQRIRKEAYDVEWLMEQAGMTQDSTPTDRNSSVLPGSPAPQIFTDQTEPAGTGNLGPAI
jgi:MFS family permease